MKMYIRDYLIQKMKKYDNTINHYKITIWYWKDEEIRETEFWVYWWLKMMFVKILLKRAIRKNDFVDINLY